MFVLDTKRISHPWAHGIDGVTYCRDIADIHDQLIELGQIGRLRTRIADEVGIDADPKTIGPRVLILLEEINAIMKQLARYWEKIRESGGPKASPALDALNEILYMGRQLRMHVLLVAQSATARALGGPEVREPFATRILARYSVNAWRMLAPEVHPAPKSTKHHGRAQVVIGGSARETQVLFCTETEARELATTGKKAADGPKPAALAGRPGTATEAARARRATRRRARTLPRRRPEHLGDHGRARSGPGFGRRRRLRRGGLGPQAPGRRPGDATPAAPAPAVDDQAVGLREAHEHHLTGVTVAALRYARANDRTFPGSVDKRGAELLYRVGDLKKWVR
ncbi:hypothetical protein [Streptomyces sp. NPDC056453]|uniref:hypothetical protein n=1 Tax=Streptomyces sp. NPDC056453 TaxID=3345822 RepID=UPI00369A5CED